MKLYRTTHGTIRYSDDCSCAEEYDNPNPPEGDDWTLVGSVVGETRYSVGHVFWFWEKTVTASEEDPSK